MYKDIKKVLSGVHKKLTKQQEEVGFWVHELENYKKWYSGSMETLYGVKSPKTADRVEVYNSKDSAILTWFKLHQQPKYLKDLGLKKNSLKGLKVLDIGAGPMPSATVFEGIDLYCLDQLYGEYMQAGYPLHYYKNTQFINASSEDIPAENSYFDAIISLNAIDHVDDLHLTAKEIRRVLKPKGKFAMHVHYHKKTPTEPIELNDDIFLQEFGWVKNLKKISTSKVKKGTIAGEGEVYVLWRNF